VEAFTLWSKGLNRKRSQLIRKFHKSEVGSLAVAKFNLKLARFNIQLTAHQQVALPPFVGSTLRGAFGHALKAIACSMPHADCRRCLLVDRCLYPRLFETSAKTVTRNENGQSHSLLKQNQDAPRPFIFDPPAIKLGNQPLRGRDDLLRERVRLKSGESLVFGLTLLGDAINELPYIVYAITLMAKHGFGFERAPFSLDQIVAIDNQGTETLVYTPQTDRILSHECTTLNELIEARLAQLELARLEARDRAGQTMGPLVATATVASSASYVGAATKLAGKNIDDTDQLTLRFVTPARIRIKGQVVETPSFVELVRGISLRLSMLTQTFGGGNVAYDYKSLLETAQGVSVKDSTLRLAALERYSNRRQGKLQLDGFIGEITFSGETLPQFVPLLVAGELLHVGSGTAFGLGRYSIATQKPFDHEGSNARSIA
jgi:hypothetical protein